MISKDKLSQSGKSYNKSYYLHNYLSNPRLMIKIHMMVTLNEVAYYVQ